MRPLQNVWNQIAQMAGIASHNTLAQNARMFALVDTSLADSVIALYDAKCVYHRWRPVTAIQAADTGNPNALSDPTWTPLTATATATDPSYPGAHDDISSAAATALADFFGHDQFRFSLTNPTLPGIVRSFQSFSAAAEEASNSRIYAGQHFRYDEDAGQTLGQQVAGLLFTLCSSLAPTRAGTATAIRATTSAAVWPGRPPDPLPPSSTARRRGSIAAGCQPRPATPGGACWRGGLPPDTATPPRCPRCRA